MRPFSPFNHRRDRELADALRAILSPVDHIVFVRRVVSRARGQVPDRVDGDSSWDVLGAWSLPGLAGAVALTLFAILGMQGVRADTPAFLSVSAPVINAQTEANTPPTNAVDGDIVLASFFEH